MTAKIYQFPDLLAQRQTIASKVANLAIADPEAIKRASQTLQELESVDEALRRLERMFADYRASKGLE